MLHPKTNISILKAILFFLIAFIVFNGLGFIIGFNITEIISFENIWLSKWVFLLSELILFIATYVYLQKIEKIPFYQEIKNSKLSLKTVITIILLAALWKIIQRPIINFWEIIGEGFRIPYLYKPELIESAFKEKGKPVFDIKYIERMMYKIFSSVLIFPLLEELIFRRYIFTGIKNKYTLALAIVVSSILFSIWHFPLPERMLYTIFSGIILAVILIRTKQILAPLLLHAFGNLFSSNFIRDFGFDYIKFMDDIEFTFLYFVIVIAALLATIYILMKLKPAPLPEIIR